MDDGTPLSMPSPHDAPLSMPLPGGIEIEPAGAAYDTDGDGVTDSVVLVGDDGELTVVSDLDGDASADRTVEVTARGEVTVAEHAGDGEWTVVEEGRLGEAPVEPVARADDGDGWAPGTARQVDSPVTVDPETGEWIK